MPKHYHKAKILRLKYSTESTYYRHSFAVTNVIYCHKPRAGEHMVSCKLNSLMSTNTCIFSATAWTAACQTQVLPGLCLVTLGVRFREMLCPSLLRKEMGDLVLAIRAAFSSAFRSSLSVSENRQKKGIP